MPMRHLLALPLAVSLVGAVGGGTCSGPLPPREASRIQARAFPLQRDGGRGVLWLEVTGADFASTDSGVSTARLIAGGREYRPLRAQVKAYEGPERTILLDDRRVERTSGALYLRYEFQDLPVRLRNARFAWTWHRKEKGAPLRWEIAGIPRRSEELAPRSGQGFEVTIPAFRWQESGPVEIPGKSLRATADRTAWFHLVVWPDRSRSKRFPEDYVGYELRFLRADNRTAAPISANGRGMVGGAVDYQDILAQFDLPAGEAGTLEWTPIFSRSTGREMEVQVPLSE